MVKGRPPPLKIFKNFQCAEEIAKYNFRYIMMIADVKLRCDAIMLHGDALKTMKLEI